jgi:hypothetical protein
MFTKDHLRTSNIFPQMTRFEQDYSPWWGGGGLVSWAHSTRVCFLQAADVMTWYWLGHAEPGGCKTAACFSLSSHPAAPYSSSHSHEDFRALEHPNLSRARDFKDTGRISSPVFQPWSKEEKRKIGPEYRKGTEKGFLNLTEITFIRKLKSPESLGRGC